MKNLIFLVLAIVAEASGTTALKLSEQFTRPVPAVITVLSYAIAFYFLSLSLRTIPIGVAYAVWAAMGIVLITIIGAVAFKQIPDLPAIIGMALIIAGSGHQSDVENECALSHLSDIISAAIVLRP